jgi:hypothetical protein
VKAIGSKVSAVRTQAQTDTALFSAGVGFAPVQAALRDQVTRRGMDISEGARLLAAVDMSIADAVSVAWDAKYRYGFWRPITAIRLADQDGNPATTADPTWEPLIATPPYPDHTSGFCSVVGALARALTRVLGTKRIDPAHRVARVGDDPDLRARRPVHSRRGRLPHLGRHPLPPGGRARPGDEHRHRRLGARPLLPAAVAVRRGLGSAP